MTSKFKYPKYYIWRGRYKNNIFRIGQLITSHSSWTIQFLKKCSCLIYVQVWVGVGSAAVSGHHQDDGEAPQVPWDARRPGVGHQGGAGRGGGGRVQPGQWSVPGGEGRQDHDGTVWAGEQCSLETDWARLTRLCIYIYIVDFTHPHQIQYYNDKIYNLQNNVNWKVCPALEWFRE